jgi:lysylphosphatidylglycerol synthetase-like protein (DUF2156 family)
MAPTSTTRPLAATILAAIQTVIAIMNVVLMTVVLIAMRSPEVARHIGHPEHEMTLDTVLVIVAAVATSLAALGLWKRWAAGWALTLALGLTVALAMLWGPVFDHDHMELDDIGVTIAYVVAIVLALWPSVRHWYLRPRASATTVPTDSTQLKSGY